MINNLNNSLATNKEDTDSLNDLMRVNEFLKKEVRWIKMLLSDEKEITQKIKTEKKLIMKAKTFYCEKFNQSEKEKETIASESQQLMMQRNDLEFTIKKQEVELKKREMRNNSLTELNISKTMKMNYIYKNLKILNNTVVNELLEKAKHL